jgi:hypothetical protein
MNIDGVTRRDFLATGLVATTALVIGVAHQREDVSNLIGESDVVPTNTGNSDADIVVPILVGSWL